jgi:hypothetical protein
MLDALAAIEWDHMMSSVIGDPFWPLLAHLGRGIASMDAGDWAGWAQFVGAMGAIYVTRQLASKSERDRKEAERRAAVLNYKICVDVFTELLIEAENAAEVAQGRGDRTQYTSKNPVSRIGRKIDVLHETVFQPLPSARAAQELAEMRRLALALDSLVTEIVLAGGHPNREVTRKESSEILARIRHITRRQRNDDGPIVRADEPF